MGQCAEQRLSTAPKRSASPCPKTYPFLAATLPTVREEHFTGILDLLVTGPPADSRFLRGVRFKLRCEVASSVGHKAIAQRVGLIRPIRYEQLFKAARAEDDQHSDFGVRTIAVAVQCPGGDPHNVVWAKREDVISEEEVDRAVTNDEDLFDRSVLMRAKSHDSLL